MWGEGDDHTLEQVEKQLNKLVPVIKVRYLGDSATQAELLLVKIGRDMQTLKEVNEIAALMKAEVVDVSKGTITLRFAGGARQVRHPLRPAAPLRHPGDRPHRGHCPGKGPVKKLEVFGQAFYKKLAERETASRDLKSGAAATRESQGRRPHARLGGKLYGTHPLPPPVRGQEL